MSFIVYASQTGFTQSYAESIAQKLGSSGSTVAVQSADELDLEKLLFKNKKDKQAIKLFIITSTTDGGNPPTSLQEFWDCINEKFTELDEQEKEAAGDESNQQLPLQHVQFSVFGVGNSNYTATYQRVAKLIVQIFKRMGAQEIVTSVLGDVSNISEFEQQFDTWVAAIAKHC